MRSIGDVPHLNHLGHVNHMLSHVLHMSPRDTT
jgi:hypothetical protein